MSKKTLVFGYVRVSTENQLENYSIDEQIDRLKAYCTAKDMLLLKIYTDGGYSGGNVDRPALKQMLSDIKTTDVDAILVYKLDRLSRSQKDTLTLIEDEFLANHVDFISINENFDTSTPFGRAMIGILSVFAQLEKDQITERFTMGRIGRGKSGYFHGGGNEPFGYTYENGELIVNETQAVIVREAYDMFLSGRSINAIFRGLAAKCGGSWSATKVRNILTNSIYIGKVKFAGIEYEGKHDSIINTDTYYSVQKLLNSPERENSKTAPQKTPFRAGYLLSSLVVCARCGARYSANHGYYKCYSRAKSSSKFIKDPDCKNDNWEIGKLDSLVVSEIYGLVESPSVIDNIIKESSYKERVEVDTNKISSRLKSLEKQMLNLVDLYQVGGIPMELLASKIKALDLEKELLQKKLESSKAPVNTSDGFLFSLKKFESNFDSSNIETRRLLVSSLVKSVHIDGLNVSIEWRV